MKQAIWTTTLLYIKGALKFELKLTESYMKILYTMTLPVVVYPQLSQTKCYAVISVVVLLYITAIWEMPPLRDQNEDDDNEIQRHW